MYRTLIITGLFAASLCGCTTVPGDSASLDILDKALDIAPAELEKRIADGDERAQYALSIVYRYGLNGREQDVHRAADLRVQALGKRTFVTASQRMVGAGTQGAPVVGPAPRNGVNSYDGRVNDACAAALASGRDSAAEAEACGGEASYRSLRDRWDRATA